MPVIKEAIILAGGLGTRLRSAVPDLPKCMAPVNGKPFIAYVIDYLRLQGIEKFILSLGYKSEAIISFINQEYSGLSIQYSIEEEPLGTGGAIAFAAKIAIEENILITNGDTIFKVDVLELSKQHLNTNAECTLSLKPMQQFDRYGVVELNAIQQVISFKEKKYYDEGLINGGLYALHLPQFFQKKFEEKFSFEKDYLEKYFSEQKMYGCIQNGYFIDIGIPEDYQKAQNEL
ncbi:MAG: nucleotidyltransferase family protein [Sphingobacteriia bacterium]|nr:nucleotidyltransferase family protein [Sphingobacteriia bacterium]